MLANEGQHQFNAGWKLENFDRHTARSKELLLSEERLVLANDDPGDSVEQDCAAAHRARRERRVQRGFAIDASRQPSGILERIHLAVQNGTSLLDAAIMATAQDASFMHQ